ncbi:MAG: S8 family serine peptidase [Saprospiraceae bacterium]
MGFLKSISTLFLLLFCTTFQILFGQKLDHVQGEFIVEVSHASDIESYKKQTFLGLRSKSSPFESRQLMTEPFNLWLIKIDFAQINEIQYERQLKSFKNFRSVRVNRLIVPRLLPNDPEFNRQWQYINTGMPDGLIGADMDMDLAWEITQGGLSPSKDTIVICVIDDGINATHEDMKDNLWINYQEIPGNGKDDDGNGYIDDYRGWNITSNSDNVYSGGTHGTSVAGIIAAKGNNAIGVSGVNWNVKLMMVNYGFASEANALASYGYAYNMRKLYNTSKGSRGAYIVVTNASWGIDKLQAEEAPLWCALYDSLGQIGVLNCGATTNSNTDVDAEGDLPTSCTSEYLISVTNLNKSDVKIQSAGFGRKSVDLGAYGHQVYTVTRTAYGTFGGTSAATPHVAGVVGLLYAAPCKVFDSIARFNPSAAALIAKDMILHGTSPNSSMTNISTTGGRLNAHRAILNLMSLCGGCSPPSGISIQAGAESVNVSWVAASDTSKVTLRYRLASTLTWVDVGIIHRNKIVTGLKNCSEYEFQLGSNCGFLPNAYSYSKFVKTAGCCVMPQITSIISTENMIGFAWSNPEAATYLLQYKSEFENWKDTLLTNKNFSLSGVPDCTGYSFKLRANCTQFGNQSLFLPEFSVSTSCGKCTDNQYCKFATKDASQEWVESFTLAGVENISGSTKGGYRSFEGLNSISVVLGIRTPLSIKAGFAGSAFAENYKIYIDYNQDGIWTESEIVMKKTANDSKEIRDTILIPTTAKTGYTRLRLIMSYNDFAGACDDKSFEYGEIEDYCVFISKEACANTAKAKIAEANFKELVFATTSSGALKDTVQLSIREKGQVTFTNIIGKDTIRIKNLKGCTLYEYQIKSLCGNVFSDPSPLDTIRTSCVNSVTNISSVVEVFPNPARDYIHIKTSGKSSEFKNIKIINTAGIQVVSQPITTWNEKYTIPTESLHTGVYFIQLMRDDGSYVVVKFIKI